MHNGAVFDLASAYRRLHWSRDQLAKRVLERWKPAEEISYRSLGNQIAHLEKGNRIWWQKRAEAAQALVDVLEIELEDLGLDRAVVGSRTAIPFHDFPAVRPFDPKAERPCEIGNEAWFDFEAITAEPRPVWIHAPAGTGWSLLGEIYRQRFGVAVQTVRTLSEVTERRTSGWVVAQVRTPDNEADLAVEKRWCDGRRVIICARFQPWEGRHGTPLTRWGPEFVTLGEPGALPWKYIPWEPVQGWRERFISWLAGRIEGGPRFNVERFVTWLNERDPSAVLFSKPADVLALASFAHEVGTKSWTEAAYERLPAQWLASRITADPASAVDAWLAGAAREAVVHAVHRWVESDAPWLQSQPQDAWRKWLPTPPAVIKVRELERHLAELDAIRSTARRAEKKQRLFTEMSRPDPEGLFLKLEADRVLAPGGSRPGDWHIQPAWLAAWLGGQHVDELVAGADAATWRRLAIFLDRQDMVDQALDRLDRPSFETAVQRAVASFEHRSLPAIAAVESLFLAVGRRLGKGEKLERTVLASLWDRAVESLDRRRDDQPGVPLTRLGPSEGHRGVQWVEACWEWCLAIPRPATVPAGAEWLFPGWFPLSFDALPYWLYERFDLSSRMVQLAEALIGSRVTGEPRSSTPLWIQAPVLVARLKQGADPRDLTRSVLSEESGLRYLLGRAPELGQEARAWLARDIWYCTYSTAPSPDSADPADAAIRAFLNENLTELDLRSALRSHGAIRRDAVSRLSPALQRVTLHYWLEHRPEELAMFVREHAVDGELLDLMAERMSPAHAAQILWKRDPARALRITERMVHERPEDAQSWFSEGARHDLTTLLALLERLQRPPQWVHRWLTQLLIAEPAFAERIHALRLRVRG